MADTETYSLVREGLQEILPDKYEIGYSYLDTVIEAAIDDDDINDLFEAESGGAANSVFDTLQDLYEAAQLILVCVKIWKSVKPKPPEKHFLETVSQSTTSRPKNKAAFDELCKRIYAWLSRTKA